MLNWLLDQYFSLPCILYTFELYFRWTNTSDMCFSMVGVDLTQNFSKMNTGTLDKRVSGATVDVSSCLGTGHTDNL